MQYNVAPHLILQKQNKILLLYRENTPVCNQLWCTPTGAIEPGETPSEAMIREAFEELGIEVDGLKQVATVFYTGPDFFDPSKPYCDLDIFFTASSYLGTPFNKEPHKHKEIQWFDMDHLLENMIPVARHGIQCYRDGVAYSEFRSDFMWNKN